MKLSATIAVAPLLLAMAAPQARAQDGHQQHHASAPVAMQAPAQRLDTDAPLRQGMGQIRAAVNTLQHYERGHMGPEQAVALATQIQQQVAGLVANCKLEPQADAVLHVIIAGLAQDAQALKSNPADIGAIPRMREALRQYSQQFNDPGWASVDEPKAVR